MAVGLPCLNPNCKSLGIPHPNCRCYSRSYSLAEGGAVDSHYCASNRPHKASCEYFASGGTVAAQSPTDAATAAIAHGGASMLFGKANSPFLGAFGSKAGIGDVEGHVARYQGHVKKGSKALEQGVKGLFEGKIPDHEPVDAKEIERIKDYVANGGHLAEMQAQSDKPGDPLANLFPEQNIALNTTKARVSNYLNTLRPSSVTTKLPFDSAPSTTKQDKDYHGAVKLAASPLSILRHVGQGRLMPDTRKHFANMYPELHDDMSKRMTQGIAEAQLDSRKPSYRVRQAMSLFMGAPLDSTFTPQSIIAAQQAFAPKAPPQGAPAPSKNKKGTATLTKASEQYETGSQAAETRKRQ